MFQSQERLSKWRQNFVKKWLTIFLTKSSKFCIVRTRVPIYWEFGHGGSSNFCPWRHFVSKLDTSLYSKSMGNSCQLSYYCVPFENEAVKPIKSIHIWKANTITIPNMDMLVSVYRVGKKHIGCNIKNKEICSYLYWRRSFFMFLVHFQQNH